MKKYQLLAVATIVAPIVLAQPALAKPGDPITVSENLVIDPIVEGRLRYETVDQSTGLESADALTMRLRAGVEFTINSISFLAEGEGTLAIIDNYNDTIAANGIEPFPVVADPDNVELNRIQVAYAGPGGSFTLGRQRIILDNARFVGNVGWRQSEQTFDAVRGIIKIGPVSLDGTYAISQRTVFGSESPNAHFDGNIFLVNGGIKARFVDVKAFAYLIDYDKRLAFSSQTFGGLAKAAIPFGEKIKLDLMASYARQADYQGNPVDYSADYIAGELGASFYGFGIKAGYEELGSDDGVAAFQTPLATLHGFNGWADVFLTTPATGLRDYYSSVSKGLGSLGPLKGLNAAVAYHKFESDFGGTDYGDEWDASLGFSIGNYALLLKYANFKSDAVGLADTEKFWAQFEFKY